MIHGKNVLLRALEPSDIDLMYEWENDLEVWPVSGTLTPFSRHTMEQFVSAAHQDIYMNKQLRLAIELKTETGSRSNTIGYLDLYDFEPAHLRAGVGILIADKKNRRKGYALESLDLLAQYAFKVLNLHQLYCHIHVSNHASIKLFTSAGYKRTGELADWTLSNGNWVNVCFMQKINPR
jgi:diamine N-acetyltransferase